MMNFLSRLRKDHAYESLLWVESKVAPGVRFQIRKVSLGQRIDLSARIRDLTFRNEFLLAGDPADQLEAAKADLLARKLYLEWALTHLEGLKIDGKPANVELLVERGPEELVNEIASAIREQLELSESETKN